MQAIVINDYGSQFHKDNVSMPTISDKKVLIQVKAASVNRMDASLKNGALKQITNYDFPTVLGMDVAGIVAKVGAKVTNFKVGDEVFGSTGSIKTNRGAFAEYTSIFASHLAIKSKQLSFKQAAAVPTAGITAWQTICDRLKIQPHEKVLIQGGSGGVGSFAIQIAKGLGAYVATTASSNHIAMVKSLGADQVIDHNQDSIVNKLKDYDAVLDTTGNIDDELKILKPDGRLVSIVKDPDQKQKDASQSVTFLSSKPKSKELAQIDQWIIDGKISVQIAKEFPFTATGLQDAFKLVESHHAGGKAVIDINNE